MIADHLLSVLLGSVVGFSTGLSGAGGSLLAIPLLVTGLAYAPRDALATSLAATGVSCLVGVIPRIRAGLVDFRAGLLFAGAGMLGAPPGTWFASRVPETVLLASLTALMVLIAIRMLWPSERRSTEASTPEGRRLVIPLFGLLVGFLSGVFGIGCGFLVVPGLVLLAGVSIRRAIATTLFVMSLVCSTGAVSYFAAGKGLAEPTLSMFFVLGAALGVLTGGRAAGFLSDLVLRRVFGCLLLAVTALLTTQLLGH